MTTQPLDQFGNIIRDPVDSYYPDTQLKPVRRRVSVETMAKNPAIMEWMHPEVPREDVDE